MSGRARVAVEGLPGLQVAFTAEGPMEGHLTLSTKEQTKLIILELSLIHI